MVRSRHSIASRVALLPISLITLLVGVSLPATSLAVGPFWHVDTFNAANLTTTSPNHAMWCGVPVGTPGYATAPGYGNNLNDRLTWRVTVPNPTTPTTVRLRFVFNYDLQPGVDFLRVEWETSGGAFVALAAITGSNKNPMGQFVTPATFDQIWTIPGGAYGGPLGNQVVLRLRGVSSPSGSDQDGGYNSSGACQVDNVLVELNGNPASSADFETSGGSGGWTAFDRQAVADYVRDNVLGGNYASVIIRMPSQPVDQTHVARDYDPQTPDVTMPYALTWVVLIDDVPGANWGHACRWVAVNADLTGHAGPITRTFPPLVLGGGGSGPRVPLDCGGFTPVVCPPLDDPPSIGPGPEGDEGPCLSAVLISGGLNPDDNHRNYRTNLTSMYQTLREIGYPKANIFVYYADGASLDLDNLDGDGDHATGSDVTAEARISLIRDRITTMCSTLDRRRDVLFIYSTNHGGESGWLMLYGLDDEAVWWYRPDEFADDTRNCDVCRLFVLMDQCYSGAFAPLVTDGDHDNMAFYSAATALEPSWGREYMAEWEDLDPATQTMNELHALVEAGYITSQPVMAEGTPGNGDTFLNNCGALESCHVPWDTPLCADEDQVEMGVTICNLLNNNHTYDLSFSSDAAGADGGCTVGGPTVFTVLDPLPVAVPSGACARVRVRIDRPADMDALLEVGCFTATVTNVERGNSFACRGSLWDRRDLCPRWQAYNSAQIFQVAQPRRYTIVLTNTGSGPGAASPSNPPPNPLPYQLNVVASDMSGAANTLVSLNGLPPGTPVTGSLPLPAPGQSTEVAVDVRFTQADPFFYDLVLEADTDGDQVIEPLASMGLRASVDGVTSVPSLAAARPLRVLPNPLRGGAVVEFAPGGDRPVPVTLEVLDMLGRKVCTLASGASAGPGPARWTWIGNDDRGQRMPAGVYVVRLTTSGRVQTAKAVVLR